MPIINSMENKLGTEFIKYKFLLIRISFYHEINRYSNYVTESKIVFRLYPVKIRIYFTQSFFCSFQFLFLFFYVFVNLLTTLFHLFIESYSLFMLFFLDSINNVKNLLNLFLAMRINRFLYHVIQFRSELHKSSCKLLTANCKVKNSSSVIYILSSIISSLIYLSKLYFLHHTLFSNHPD